MKTIKINKWNIFYAVIMFLFFAATVKFVSPAAIAVFNAGIAKNEKKLPIYSVETNEKKLSISFDAAWGADDTDELLRILDENNVKATFFMCGYWVDDFPAEVIKIAMSGHDLANHSSTHPHMSKLSKEEIKEELMDTHNKVLELTGEEMELFRPPFGEYTNSVIETAEELGYYTIQWNIDILETKINPSLEGFIFSLLFMIC